MARIYKRNQVEGIIGRRGRQDIPFRETFAIVLPQILTLEKFRKNTLKQKYSENKKIRNS